MILANKYVFTNALTLVRLTGDGLTLSARIDADVLAADYTIVEPEIDWNKVIEKRILCEFWDCDNTPKERRHLGILTLISKDVFFRSQEAYYWSHCRPLRADEVKLVTDEKELWK